VFKKINAFAALVKAKVKSNGLFDLMLKSKSNDLQKSKSKLKPNDFDI